VRRGLIGRFGMAALLASLAAPSLAAAGDRVYQLDYDIRLRPVEKLADVRVEVRQPGHYVRELRFRIRPEWHSGFVADGELGLEETAAVWRPPAKGGVLRFVARVDHRRNDNGYDAYMTDDWAVFRGDDLVPPAAVRALKGAQSSARLKLTGPPGWAIVTPYPKLDESWRSVAHAHRRFDRPTGWMAAGKLGVRRGMIDEVRVTVAGPMGEGVRRLDIMAFLRWNLAALKDVFPAFPERLLIVSAGDPMWRGGLSGPASLYLHADRPLISENGTSTLLHELVHVAQGYGAAPGADWIVEGLAEYYGLEIMRRTGTLGPKRFQRALDKVARWGEEADELSTDYSRGAVTARAVTLFRKLDIELKKKTDGKRNLDDVARRFSEEDLPVSVERLRNVSEELAGGPLESLCDANIPCPEPPR
jgi:hypothetical protein